MVKYAVSEMKGNILIAIILPIVIIAILVISFFVGATETGQGDSNNFDGIYGDTVQEKVWFALKDLGYGDMQVAGAMGNIHCESAGFTTTAVEGNGEGIGLIQWSYRKKRTINCLCRIKRGDLARRGYTNRIFSCRNIRSRTCIRVCI